MYVYVCLYVFILYLYYRLSRNGAFSRFCVRHMCNVVWGQANSNTNAQYKLSMHMYACICVCVRACGCVGKANNCNRPSPRVGPGPRPRHGSRFSSQRTYRAVCRLIVVAVAFITPHTALVCVQMYVCVCGYPQS